MSSTIIDTIRLAAENRTVVTVHSNRADYGLINTGYVDCLNNNETRLVVFSSFGFYDGWRVIRNEDIFAVDCDGLFEHRIAYLSSLNQSQHAPITHQSKQGESLILDSIQHALASRILLSLRLGDDDDLLRGFALTCSNDTVTLALCTEYGVPDGRCVLPLAELHYISFGSMIGQRIQHLAEHQQEFLEFRKQQIR